MHGTADEIHALLREWESAADPDPLVIATSGSTGTPKRVVLSRRAMRASADATHERLGGPGQWLLNLPPAYVAGVQVLFRSVRAGVDPVALHGTLGEAIRSMTGPRRYVSLVPTQLERLVRDADLADLAQVDAVLVGGGPLRPDTRRAAEAAGVRVVQTYGMSETCGGCVYDGVPLDGVSVRVDRAGEVLVAGPMLFEGYEDEPARTAAVLENGWLRTRDLGEIDDDGRLRILGRVDDVVISGGVKVPALAVQRQLEESPDLAAVAVVGVPDDEWGQRVVAVVVPVPGARPDLAALRDLVTPRTWAPRRLAVVDALPLLPNGKPDPAALSRVAADA